MEMMKKEKSPGVSKMKLLLVLPAIALLVFAFAKKEYVVEESVLAPSNSNSLNINQNTNQLNEDNSIKVKGIVLNSDGTFLTGASVLLNNTNTGTVVDQNGEFELDAPDEFTLVVSFVGFKTIRNNYSFKGKTDAKVRITMEKGVFNIELPEIGGGEELVKGENKDVPPPPPPPKKQRNDEVFEVVEEMPYYSKAGVYQLAMDIKKEAELIKKETGDRGTTVVGFTLTANGNIANYQVVESSGSKRLDESALKIVTKLDNWNPGIQRGKRVPVDLTVPVNFN